MAAKLLANQLKSLMNDPVEGFTVELVNDSSLYEWKVYLEGPADTYYQGGIFQLLLSFPKDYPMSPPTLKFISEFWHPNVYARDGRVCISILHPPGEDILSGELPQERWLPTQSVTTIILSLMSILSDPNCSSPANVDASVEWRSNKELYKKRCGKIIEKANKLKPSHITIPHPDTNPEEHRRYVEKIKKQEQGVDMDYLQYSDTGYDDEDDEEEDDETDDNNVDDEDDDETDNEEEQQVVNNSNQQVVENNQAVVVVSEKNNDDNNDGSIVSSADNRNSVSADIIISDSPQQTQVKSPNNEINNGNDNNEVSTVIVSPPTNENSNSTSTTTTTIPTTDNNNNETIVTPPTIAISPPVNNNDNNENNNNNNNNVNVDNNNNNNENNNNVLPPARRRKKKSKKCLLM